VTVTLATDTPGATIRYTTDDSTPTAASPAYGLPFSVTATGPIKARAFAPGMTDSAVASATFSITPAGSGATTAQFVGLDTTTRGTWRGVYGSNGFVLAGDTIQYPSYAQVRVVAPPPFTWSSSTAEPGALQRATGPGRLAATWYDGRTFSIDIKVTDGQTHQVGVYALDWGTQTRAQRVDVRDGVTGALLDSRPMSAFWGGQYLIWRVSGHVTLHVTCTAGINAVISGVFFDPATP
jgi:hypothetical protein